MNIKHALGMVRSDVHPTGGDFSKIAVTHRTLGLLITKFSAPVSKSLSLSLALICNQENPSGLVHLGKRGLSITKSLVGSDPGKHKKGSS